MIVFTGQVADEKELTGNETLEDLLKIFQLENAIFSSPVLPRVSGHVEAEIREQQEIITKEMEAIRRETFLPSETENTEYALRHLGLSYLFAELGSKYHEISPKLFKLEREVQVMLDKRKHPTNIPLLASAELNEGSTWTYEKSDESHNKIKFSSKVPPIPKEAKERAREARADYFEALRNALRVPIIGDWLIARGHMHIYQQNLRVYWIPADEELKIEIEKANKDPFIISEIGGKNFLVTSWYVKGELPFQHYLEEFKIKRKTLGQN